MDLSWIADIFNGENALQTIITIIVVILIMAILAKTGLISFKSDKLSIGTSYMDKERTIIRQQIEYAENACMSFIWNQNRTEDEKEDPFKIKYTNERIFDCVIAWISFNHITTDDTYVEIKQNIIWSLVTSITSDDYYKSEEFHSICDDQTKTIIKKLCDIRKYYSKN